MLARDRVWVVDGAVVPGPLTGHSRPSPATPGPAGHSNRKAKLIFFYELVVKLKWKGEAADGSAAAGTASIPNLSEENDMDEIEFEVALTSDRTPEREKVKELLRKQGLKPLQALLKQWLTALRDDYCGNLIKPTKASSASSIGEGTSAAAAAATPATTSAAAAAAPAAAPAAPVGVKIASSLPPVAKAPDAAYKDLKLSDKFKCRAQDLFAALTDEARVRAYTQSPASVDPKVGGAFSLFSGNVTGVFKDVKPYELLTQAWRMKTWAENHHSEVTLKILDLGDECKLELTQTGIPAADYESVKVGWRAHQWDRMKGILGFGSGLGMSF